MVYLVYDASFEGFLTVVFEVYERNLGDVQIQKQQLPLPQLFTDVIHIQTDERKAKRVWTGLVALIAQNGIKTLWKAWLSELDTIENTLLQVIRYAIKNKQNILNDYGDLYVLRLQQAVKSVEREKHRMKAFVRFQLTKDNLYYATVEPDFNVLPLIISHFESRYADQSWFIYDLKRKYGIYYNLKTVEFVTLQPGDGVNESKPGATLLAENEELYAALWKTYFQHTNIHSRKNTKLHLQHVPKRYWKYLTEKFPTP
jgi:probable DNA metabolism protein